MADNADMATDITDSATEVAIINLRKQAQLPAGVAGECEHCLDDSPRLIGGACARCRDALRLP